MALKRQIKALLKELKEWLVYWRYRLLVFMGFGFEYQFRYFPDHKIRKNVFIIPRKYIKWAYNSNLTPPKRLISNNNWDLEYRLDLQEFFRKNDSCHSVFQIFSEGLPFSESDQYKTIKKYILAGKVGPGWEARGCYSVEEIDRYFQMLTKTFNNMKKYGYKSQQELGNPDIYDELTVVIDRNGEFQKQEGEGHHRLAMAFLLEIPALPVVINRVHFEWARKQYLKYGKDLLTSITLALKSYATE